MAFLRDYLRILGCTFIVSAEEVSIFDSGKNNFYYYEFPCPICNSAIITEWELEYRDTVDALCINCRIEFVFHTEVINGKFKVSVKDVDEDEESTV